MRLAVNIDHFATLRQARESDEPEPALAALLAEQAGAHGIVCHIRGDRRHIKERDLRVLRQVVKTKLNIEMAATDEMKRIALDVKPNVVSLVPEREEELTTEGGLNVTPLQSQLRPFIQELQGSDIHVSIFVDPDIKQLDTCLKLNVNLVELNTGKYAELKQGPDRERALSELQAAAAHGRKNDLEIHAGHGLDYRNIHPVAAIPEISEFSIGFAIVARAAIVGVKTAVQEMLALIS
ncbi:MAG: pyridoxine 5'-phosphate synthase [Candidatus Aminicenantes bacterium]|nr:pyridoxine 5'-phosphate synthase [Candidatus Aminicenantes bacterium]